MRAAVVLILCVLGACKAVSATPDAGVGRPPAPGEVAKAVALVEVSALGRSDELTQPIAKTGTAWALGNNGLFVTAGHVCPNLNERFALNGKVWVVAAVQIKLKMFDGSRVDAVEVVDDEDADVCVVRTGTRVRGLSLAVVDPKFGDYIWYVGYPHNSLSMIEGRWASFGSDRRASLAVYPGASGSPVLDSRGLVVGIVVSYDSDFHHVAYVADLPAVRRAEAGATIK